MMLSGKCISCPYTKAVHNVFSCLLVLNHYKSSLFVCYCGNLLVTLMLMQQLETSTFGHMFVNCCLALPQIHKHDGQKPLGPLQYTELITSVCFLSMY